MNLSVELGTVVIEVFLAWYFYTGAVGTSGFGWRKTLLYYAAYGLFVTICSLFISIALLKVIIIAGVSILIWKRLYQQEWMKTAYTVALFLIMTILADVLCGGILLLAGLSSEEIMGSGVGRLVYNSFAKLVHLFLLHLILTGMKTRYDVRALKWAAPLLAGQAASAFICHQNMLALLAKGDAVLITVETGCLLYINLIICAYVEVLKQSYENREIAAVAEQKLAIQKEYYQDVLNRQEETRALWHDIKKYMTAMEDLVHSEDRPEAEQCFAQAKAAFSNIEDAVDVGNQVINSILSHGLKKCRAQGVPLKMDIWVDEHLSIPASDLYIIMGNTLDNAIEASQQLSEEERIITLSLNQKNHMLYYEISNVYTESTPKKSGVHGYGLRNVRNCVYQNNGHMEIIRENGSFTVSIQLKLL